jgi:hypothetical protein
MMRRSAGLTTSAQDAATAVEPAVPARSDHDGRDAGVDPGQAGRALASNVIVAAQINAEVFNINEIRLILISQIHAWGCKLSLGFNGHIASHQGPTAGWQAKPTRARLSAVGSNLRQQQQPGLSDAWELCAHLMSNCTS